VKAGLNRAVRQGPVALVIWLVGADLQSAVGFATVAHGVSVATSRTCVRSFEKKTCVILHKEDVFNLMRDRGDL